MGVEYQTVNVLEDAEIREGIKAFSQWPTIPQLYIKASLLADATSSSICIKMVSLTPFWMRKKSSARRPDHPWWRASASDRARRRLIKKILR